MTAHAELNSIPPVLGIYSVKDGTLVFRPQFPLAPGVRYQAIFHPPNGPLIATNFDGPRKATRPETRVAHVYPTTDVLPSNTLKLYIYFSEPMSRGEAWQHIRLLDASGKPLPRVFLELGQELWDPSFTRLTVLFDPGRIKRGVVSNERMGPPIVEGKRYTLVVDRDWHDARGVPLVEGFRKEFRGGPADRDAPDPGRWHIIAPMAGTTAPLVVNFGKPMDYALLQRALTISGPLNSAQPGPGVAAFTGKIEVEREETEWRCTPNAAWHPGNYSLLISTDIEDLSGNKIGHPFDLDDIDEFKRVTEHIDVKSVAVPFTVR